MGWDFGMAKHWKNGKIDRKAECDERLTWGSNRVLKSSMVGSTYYAAVEIERDGRRDVIGAVILTSTEGRDMGMKILDESSGPYNCECPKSILTLLTPTDSDWANEWRKKCYEYHDKKEREKKDKYSLKNLPEGTKIDFVAPFTSSAAREGEHVTLEKKVVSWKYVWDQKTGERKVKKRIAWSDGYCTWPTKFIPEDYRVQTKTELIDKQSRDMIYSGAWTA